MKSEKNLKKIHPKDAVLRLRKKQTLQLFFDFYVLNDLWFNTVGYNIEYGYPLNRILPHRKEERIDELFRSRVAELKKWVIIYLERSVRGEITHWHFYGKRDDYSNAYQKRVNRQVLKYKKLYGGISKWPLEKIYWLFNRTWEYSDYGGRKWAKGVKELICLKNSKSIKDDIFHLDRVFDLQHNNGFILNKGPMKVLEQLSLKLEKLKHRKYDPYNTFSQWKWGRPLDVRFKSTPLQMLRWCSTPAQYLYKANLNYLPHVNKK